MAKVNPSQFISNGASKSFPIYLTGKLVSCIKTLYPSIKD